MRLVVCVLRRFSHVRVFVTPWTVCNSLDSSLHGILQAKILGWAAVPFLRGSSWSRDRTHVSHVSCIGRCILYHWATGEAPQPFPRHGHWGFWGARGRNRTTRTPQFGSELADEVLTQPRSTDIDSTRVWSKAFSSSVTPTTFQVLSSIMWSGARVLDRADVWKVQSSPRILLDIPLQITEACRENTCPREALPVLCESTDICKFCLFCFLSPKPTIWASFAF